MSLVEGAIDGRQSRAVVRSTTRGGEHVTCSACGEAVRFSDRVKAICNVYEDGVWQRVEQFHERCYVDAGEPYGSPERDERAVAAAGRPPASNRHGAK